MTAPTWHEANQTWLEAEMARLRSLLGASGAGPTEASAARLGGLLDDDSPPALLRLARLFGLSPFERDLLLLAAAPELDPSFAALCAAAQGEPERPFPTFALALGVLDEARWDALAPNASLRHWRLLEVLPGAGLMASRLHVDERIVHYLRGLDVLDGRLAGMVSMLPPIDVLVPSHQRLAERLAGIWSQAEGETPVVLLCGADRAGKRAVAAAACAALGLAVQVMPAVMVPTVPTELDGLARLLARDAVLSRRALLLDCESHADAEPPDRAGARLDIAARLAEALRAPLLVMLPERHRLGDRLLVTLDVERPAAVEQAALWHAALAEQAPGGSAVVDRSIADLTAQFDLGTDAIRSAGADAVERIAAAQPLAAALWSACRTHARPTIESLAKRLRPSVGWADLVLPAAERRVLEEIAVHVRHRAQVHDRWGFARRSSRGLGISALFVGPSGTGKTMAAEVLAHELELDLYRIDLASVVSKYIGETEKNLKRIFDAADQGGAILLFDEADALFGKRSEVKDSHDRYANIEVGYLLQRIEAYRGLALLTTNLKDGLDPAFLRRLRFLVRFPFPDQRLRADIWRRVFPPETPTADLDFDRLARLGLAGGHIKSIAIAAAFRAAEEGSAVGMGQVLAAARSEYAKLEKPFTEKGLEVSP